MESDRMGIRPLLVAGLLGIAILGYFLLRAQPVSRPDSQVKDVAVLTVRRSATAVRKTAERPFNENAAKPRRAPAPVEYRQLLEGSNNYYDAVKDLFEKARTGDRDAQYYLSVALDYCDEGYRMYFKSGARRRSIDEALQWFSTRPFLGTQEQVQRVYDRCNGLMTNDLPQWGAARVWLTRATDAGQPDAQAKTALLLVNAAIMAGFAASGGIVKPDIVESKIQDPHALLRAAVRSKDPEVLLRIGELQGALQNAEQTAGATGSVLDKDWENRLAWWLVACRREPADCTEHAQWHRVQCRFDPNCPPGESGIDYIYRMIQTQNLIDVEERAQEIDAKLDAGAWDQLGL